MLGGGPEVQLAVFATQKMGGWKDGNFFLGKLLLLVFGECELIFSWWMFFPTRKK